MMRDTLLKAWCINQISHQLFKTCFSSMFSVENCSNISLRRNCVYVLTLLYDLPLLFLPWRRLRRSIQVGAFAIHGLHGPDDEPVKWQDGGGDLRRSEYLERKKKREKDCLKQDSLFDMTSFGKPMPGFLRHRFRSQFLMSTSNFKMYYSWLKNGSYS